MDGKNSKGLMTEDGSIGGRGDSYATSAKYAAAFVAVAVVALHGEPAHADMWDPVLDIIDQTTTAFETVVARFILLVGLIGAWIYAAMTKSFANGFIGSIIVVGFAALVAGTDQIASELGFGAG